MIINDKNHNHCDCVYCEKSGHRAVGDIKQRRLIVSKKKLCFNCSRINNCTRIKYQVSECLSNKLCVKYKEEHHSLICVKTTTTMLTTISCSVTCLAPLIEIEGVKCRTFIDTRVGATGASYTSSTLINHINKKPIRAETKKFETLISTNTRKIKIYSVIIQDMNCECGLETELNHLEREVLLELSNPTYQKLQNTYVHLKDLQINYLDPKSELPVHVILGITDYTEIKT